MSLYPTAGCKMYIGTALEQQSDDFVAADFTGITFTEITSLENMGSVGDTSQSITFDAINEQRTKVLKGTRSAGTMELVCGVDATDPGQLACIAAERTLSDYAFKIEINDRPSAGASPKNGMRYFIAKVMSQQEVFDSANNVRKINFTLAVNSNVVHVAASAS